jgi:hypothetical protein
MLVVEVGMGIQLLEQVGQVVGQTERFLIHRQGTMHHLQRQIPVVGVEVVEVVAGREVQAAPVL